MLPTNYRLGVRERLGSLRLALLTVPGRKAWGQSLWVFGLFLILAVVIGGLSGFLRLELMVGSWRDYAVLLAVLLITPSLLEEVVFRGLLLPHPREGASRRQTLSYAAVSLGIFLVWHPLNGWLFRPAVLPLFGDPIFLSLAALLGGATMTAYLRSASLWPAILLHWLTVVTWIVFFGGSCALGA